MNAQRPQPPVEHWTIDRKIPIFFVASLAIGLILQAAGIVWYFAKLEARQTTVEEQVAASAVSVEKDFEEVEKGFADVDLDQNRLANILTGLMERTTRLETDYLSSKTDVARRLGNIEVKLDRIMEALPQRRSDIDPLPKLPYQQRAAE